MDDVRVLDRETHDYLYGLRLGLIHLRYETYDPGLTDNNEFEREGYRDALDDSNNYPDPVDLEETLIP